MLFQIIDPRDQRNLLLHNNYIYILKNKVKFDLDIKKSTYKQNLFF